jgi:catalase
VRSAVLGAGMVPLLIGPHGGKLPNGLPVQRTFLTARSVEYDAVLLAGAPAPAPDATPGRDAKVAEAAPLPVDPRVKLLVDEAFRHAKAVGGWGAGSSALEGFGYLPADAGVVMGEDAEAVTSEVLGLMGSHRVWERFPATSA